MPRYSYLENKAKHSTYSSPVEPKEKIRFKIILITTLYKKNIVIPSNRCWYNRYHKYYKKYCTTAQPVWLHKPKSNQLQSLWKCNVWKVRWKSVAERVMSDEIPIHDDEKYSYENSEKHVFIVAPPFSVYLKI